MTVPGGVPEELLSAWLDGELTADERGAVEDALATSPGARAALAELSAARDVVRSLPVRDVPPGFLAGVTRSAPRRRRAFGWVAALAAAAAVTVAVVLPTRARARPPIQAFVQSHAARASQNGDPISELAPATAVRLRR